MRISLDTGNWKIMLSVPGK
uniref:Uncharacterized protein n=1 Tax=Arundo donax TaxID=35708 RepID=A0A0A8Y9G5_ARUDO